MSIVNKLKGAWRGFQNPEVNVPSPVAELPEVSQAIEVETVLNPGVVGLTDAVRSGWYLKDSAELYRGFKILEDDVVLDVGCGDGLATLFCADFGPHIVFTDVVESKIDELVSKAKRSKARKVEGILSDSLPLPLADGYASKILSMEVLEHTHAPDKILKELYRVGKPGAQYLISVPDSRSENLQKTYAHPSYFEEPNHIHIFDKTQFIDLVEGAGLIVEEYSTWGFFWTMWMSIFWSVPSVADTDGAETIGLLSPPYHPALQAWTKTWQEVLMSKNGQGFIDAMNTTYPKAQLILARKPL